MSMLMFVAKEERRQEGQMKALRGVILETLLVRFGTVPDGVGARIDAKMDLAKLQEMHRQAVGCKDLAEFESVAGISGAD